MPKSNPTREGTPQITFLLCGLKNRPLLCRSHVSPPPKISPEVPPVLLGWSLVPADRYYSAKITTDPSKIKFLAKIAEIGPHGGYPQHGNFQEFSTSGQDISITKGHMTKRGKTCRGNTPFFRSPKGFVRRMNHRIEKNLKIPYPLISGFWNGILFK